LAETEPTRASQHAVEKADRGTSRVRREGRLPQQRGTKWGTLRTVNYAKDEYGGTDPAPKARHYQAPKRKIFLGMGEGTTAGRRVAGRH